MLTPEYLIYFWRRFPKRPRLAFNLKLAISIEIYTQIGWVFGEKRSARHNIVLASKKLYVAGNIGGFDAGDGLASTC